MISGWGSDIRVFKSHGMVFKRWNMCARSCLIHMSVGPFEKCKHGRRWRGVASLASATCRKDPWLTDPFRPRSWPQGPREYYNVPLPVI